MPISQNPLQRCCPLARRRKFNKPRLNTSERQPQKEYVQVLDLLMMFSMAARWKDRAPGHVHLRHSDGHQVFCLAGKSLRRLLSARYHGGLAEPINRVEPLSARASVSVIDLQIRDRIGDNQRAIRSDPIHSEQFGLAARRRLQRTQQAVTNQVARNE
jgi:hypothetical protein